jgi:hypothetical protein
MQDFVDKYCVPVEGSKNHTIGMFGEEVPLGEWTIKEGVELASLKYISNVKEEEFAAPWSSGPMIFTHLRFADDKGGFYYCYEWWTDPTEEDEYDREKGCFYV